MPSAGFSGLNRLKGAASRRGESLRAARSVRPRFQRAASQTGKGFEGCKGDQQRQRGKRRSGRSDLCKARTCQKHAGKNEGGDDIKTKAGIGLDMVHCDVGTIFTGIGIAHTAGAGQKASPASASSL